MAILNYFIEIKFERKVTLIKPGTKQWEQESVLYNILCNHIFDSYTEKGDQNFFKNACLNKTASSCSWSLAKNIL